MSHNTTLTNLNPVSIPSAVAKTLAPAYGVLRYSASDNNNYPNVVSFKLPNLLIGPAMTEAYEKEEVVGNYYVLSSNTKFSYAVALPSGPSGFDIITELDPQYPPPSPPVVDPIDPKYIDWVKLFEQFKALVYAAEYQMWKQMVDIWLKAGGGSNQMDTIEEISQNINPFYELKNAWFLAWVAKGESKPVTIADMSTFLVNECGLWEGIFG